MNTTKKERWQVYIGGIITGSLITIGTYYLVKFIQWIIWANAFIEANLR